MQLETKKSFDLNELNQITELFAAAHAADNHHPLGEHAYLDITLGGRSNYATIIAKDIGHNHLIGLSHLSKGKTSWAIDYVIHPHHRNESDTEMQLIKASLDEIQRSGGGHVHMWVPKPTEQADKIALSMGFRRGRDLFQMKAKLDRHFEEPKIDIRTFQPQKDEVSWLELNNKAFRQHPEQGDWDIETLKARLIQRWFDSSGFFVAETEGKLIATCWVKVHHEMEPVTGEIYVMAVDPIYAGKGLGTQMCIKGLLWMKDQQIKHAMLYVDSNNEPAIKMYKKLGFEIDHIDRAYVGDFT
jgi:mycothiol synthase